MLEISQFLQKYDYDCGVAIVATVLLRFRKGFSYDSLFKILETSKKEGTVSYKMVNYLNKLAIKAQRLEKSNIEVLKEKVDKGYICVVMYQNWDTSPLDPKLRYGHYAFVKEIKDKTIVLFDPAISKDAGFGVGVYEHDIAEFERVWIDREDGKDIEKAFICISE